MTNLHKRLNERVNCFLLRAALLNHKIGVGYFEKNVRRRRGNNAAPFNDNVMDSESHFLGFNL